MPESSWRSDVISSAACVSPLTSATVINTLRPIASRQVLPARHVVSSNAVYKQFGETELRGLQAARDFPLAFFIARGNTPSASEFMSIGNAMFVFWIYNSHRSTEAMLSIALGQDPRANL